MIEWFVTLPLLIKVISVYFFLITVITFFYFGFDKMQSTHSGERRVSEKTLWTLALVGGSVGALLGMKYFRHKTKKLSFQAGMAVVLTVQVGVIVWIMQNYA